MDGIESVDGVIPGGGGGGGGTWRRWGGGGAAPGRVAGPLTPGQRLLRPGGVLVVQPVEELVQGGLQGLGGLGAVKLPLQPLRLQLLLSLAHGGRRKEEEGGQLGLGPPACEQGIVRHAALPGATAERQHQRVA